VEKQSSTEKEHSKLFNHRAWGGDNRSNEEGREPAYQREVGGGKEQSGYKVLPYVRKWVTLVS